MHSHLLEFGELGVVEGPEVAVLDVVVVEREELVLVFVGGQTLVKLASSCAPNLKDKATNFDRVSFFVFFGRDCSFLTLLTTGLLWLLMAT